MDDTTVTSSNAVATFTVKGLYDTPFQLYGFSAEKSWNTDQQDLAETQMGVDGRMTAGYTPMPVKQTFSLQGDSPSKIYFNTIAAATRAARDIYYISGTISIPSTGEVFIGTRGVLQAVKPIPDAAKVLQAMEFTIVWESLVPSSI